MIQRQDCGKNHNLTQNQQLGVKNLKTGKVEPTMGYPVNEMGQGDELLQLFPIPVLICPYPMDYSKEVRVDKNCETRKENKGGDASNQYITIVNQKIHLF